VKLVTSHSVEEVSNYTFSEEVSNYIFSKGSEEFSNYIFSIEVSDGRKTVRTYH